MQGIIVKAISGFYYVEAGNNLYECRARGVLKGKNIIPLVGDLCEFEPGIVNTILPRKNFFLRPPVANVETLVIVMAAANPDPSFYILDKFLVTAESMHVDIIICVNKCDLASTEIINRFKLAYSGIYPVHFICCETGEGVENLKRAVTGRQIAFAGPSGAGKSTLTNILLGKNESETGEISKKSLRGKNTTRHTQLFSGDGFKIFDTPGFTSFDASVSDEKSLATLFPEFRPCIGRCKFDDCRHLSEPECAVKNTVDAGVISQSRYKSYTDIYEFILNQKRY